MKLHIAKSAGLSQWGEIRPIIRSFSKLAITRRIIKLAGSES